MVVEPIELFLDLFIDALLVLVVALDPSINFCGEVVAVLGVEVYQFLKIPDIVLDEGNVFFSMHPNSTILVDDASVFVLEIVVTSSADGL